MGRGRADDGAFPAHVGPESRARLFARQDLGQMAERGRRTYKCPSSGMQTTACQPHGNRIVIADLTGSAHTWLVGTEASA